MPAAEMTQNPVSLEAMGLRELREARVLSQRDLAELAHVSPKTILDIEQHRIRPQPGTIRKIAAALGMDPPALAAELRRLQPPLFE
jgi:transcriptional regulator with XRE-family HTH domain